MGFGDGGHPITLPVRIDNSDACANSTAARPSAPLAALLRYRGDFAGKRVVLVVSGRNLDVDTLARALRFAQ